MHITVKFIASEFRIMMNDDAYKYVYVQICHPHGLNAYLCLCVYSDPPTHPQCLTHALTRPSMSSISVKQRPRRSLVKSPSKVSTPVLCFFPFMKVW